MRWPRLALAAFVALHIVGLVACGGGGSGYSSVSDGTAPSITSQPQSQTVTLGATATFSVTATGTAPLSYQWLQNGTAISGATSASYTTAATVSGDNGATFTVVVSNSAGSQTSQPATLTVELPPTITLQPQSQSVVVGSTATFSVVATGAAPLSYQWSKNGSVITGATDASYTTPATTSGDNGSTFTVEVSNVAGNQTSSAATLTVTAAAVAPTITTQPQNQTVTVGSTATFSVAATGTAPLSYQWSQNGAVIAGATSASYTTPATTSGETGSTFTVTVSNTAGSKTSNAATLTVSGATVAPTITTQPLSQIVTVGSTATFSVLATGTAPLSYQWSKNGATISGATSATYTTPATVSGDNGASFTVKVTNVAGSQTSSAATLTVTATAVAPSITTQPQSQTVTVGATATFSVVATGTAPLSYQWSKNGTTISGATSASYTTPATVSGDNGASFTVKVTNVAGSQTSSTATLTVNVPPTITTQPLSQIVTVGATATFSVIATGTAPLTYQWSKNGTAISGATSASYTTPVTVIGDSGSTFTVKVTNLVGSQTSSAATLTVTAVGAATPIMFQHISTSTNPVGYGESGRAFKISTEPLPANTVAVLGVTAPHGTPISVSDTLTGGAWSAAVCAADSGSSNYVSEVFVQPLGASGGVDTITVGVGSTNIQPVQFDITFWQNVNTATPTGGSLCAGNLTPNASALINPGSFTPTNNNSTGGNVIWNYTALCGAAGGNPTSWTAASGFTLLDAEIIWITKQGFPQASQYELQTSAAAVSPSITSTGDTTDCFNSATVALAAANNSAVAPSTIHVQGIGHESLSTFSSPGVLNIQVPWKGNLRVITFTWTADSPDAGPEYVSSITSSDGCNFTEGPGMHAVGGATIWYAQNCSACPTCTASLNWTGGENTAQFSFRYLDVENALPSSYQNNAAVGFTSCGTTVADQPTITPSGATNGLVIQAMGNGNGPVTGLTSPTGGVFDLWLFTGQTDGDLADNGDEVGHYYYSSTGAQNWSFTKANGADECWSGAIAFN